MVKIGKCNMRGSLYYQMSKQVRGTFIIINNLSKTLVKESKIFESIFRQFHFKVDVRKNLKITEILNLIRNLSEQKSLVKDQAFGLMLITQGRDELIFGTNACEGIDEKDESGIFEIVDIFTERNCRYLMRTPKLFFFNCFHTGKFFVE